MASDMALQRFLRRPDVERSTGLPCSTIYEMIADGRYPRPVPLGGRKVGWPEDEIADWQQTRIAERDASAHPRSRFRNLARHVISRR
jgi:prophage regulatory protein